MNDRLVVAVLAVLATSGSYASLTVTIPAGVPVCPPLSYTGTGRSMTVVNNDMLNHAYGPTPASGNAGKCGNAELKAATSSCPDNAQAHWAYDLFDFWLDPQRPVNRVFREELQINTFNGIAVGDRLQFAGLEFSSGEVVRFYFDRSSYWSTDLSVGYLACTSGCPEEEMGRYSIPDGLPADQAIPLTLTWTTGLQATQRSVGWTLGTTQPYNPAYMGWLVLSPNASEVSFRNGIVNSNCGSTESTRIRFTNPRFEPY